MAPRLAPAVPTSRRRGQVRPISVAPMMDRTDRHFRWLVRQVTREALVYTEMVTTGAVLHGDRERLLAFDAEEHPIAFQLGGDDPGALAECARIAEGLGYDEVNLNVGCPSSRVQQGRFGACLMRDPERVARAVEAMRAAVSLPVTVKHRIGVDHEDSYAFLARFVDVVATSGADRFTVHARKALLHGLSPKENRNVPPLRHADVHRLKRERPELVIEINGGLASIEAYAAHLPHVDAVMVGRAAYDDPWHLIEVDPRFFGRPAPASSRAEVALRLAEYVERVCDDHTRPLHVLRHALNLFAGVPGAKAWKRVITEHCQRGGGSGATVRQALHMVEATRTAVERVPA
jgi:tRNA-dihydrouridine synthase A